MQKPLKWSRLLNGRLIDNRAFILKSDIVIFVSMEIFSKKMFEKNYIYPDYKLNMATGKKI